jgi:hypothetical protein
MNAHTFTLPPFFFTTGSHYVNYRPGSNILNSLSRISSFKLFLDMNSGLFFKNSWSRQHVSVGNNYKHNGYRRFVDVTIFYNPRVPYTRVDSNVDHGSSIFK